MATSPLPSVLAAEAAAAAHREAERSLYASLRGSVAGLLLVLLVPWPFFMVPAMLTSAFLANAWTAASHLDWLEKEHPFLAGEG